MTPDPQRKSPQRHGAATVDLPRSVDYSRHDDRPTESDAKNMQCKREPDWEHVEADANLVRRCVAGEVAAWEELYNQCHLPLRRSIECLLPAPAPDPNLVDELASRVWFALMAEDGELLARFDRRRGTRVTTFMRAVAVDITSRHFRSERRRRRRELNSSVEQPLRAGNPSAELAASWEEFRQTLTRAERRFLDRHLDSPKDNQPTNHAYTLRLASRVRAKLRSFFLE